MTCKGLLLKCIDLLELECQWGPYISFTYTIKLLQMYGRWKMCPLGKINIYFYYPILCPKGVESRIFFIPWETFPLPPPHAMKFVNNILWICFLWYSNTYIWSWLNLFNWWIIKGYWLMELPFFQYFVLPKTEKNYKFSTEKTEKAK